MTKFVLLLCGILVFSLSAVAQQGTPSGLTVSEKEKMEGLIRSMTLDEKIGQLSLYNSSWDITSLTFNGEYRNLVRQGKVGAILNAYTVDAVRNLQKSAVEETRLKIPMLFGYDVIHGHRTIFPIPLAQACMWDLAAVEQIERIAATEATAEGINWTFAPMVDITLDPRWGRVDEGSGEDTWLGCKIAEARVKGFQGNDLKANNTLLSCVKHFAAYGASQAGRDYNTVDMSQVSLYEWYLPPYKAAIDAGSGSVMTSFNEIAGVPSTASHWLMTELLRKEWGFNGFVVTDYNAINEMINHGVAANLKDAAMLAINAGVDMDMQGGAYISSLDELVKENKVSMDRIDEAVRVVLGAKFKLGLFDDPYRYCSIERQEKETMTQKNQDFARKTVAESCVLLKNENQTLPIPGGVKTIAVIGPMGNSKQDMLGCWSAAGNRDKCVTLLEGIRNRTGKKVTVSYARGCNTNDSDRSSMDSAIQVARGADFVILALGENEWMTGEAASRASIHLPGIQDELAEAIVKTGKPVAAILFNGRPLVLTSLCKVVPAILESWFGGTQAGNGIADVLFGDVNPSGKITMTFPRSEGQIPVFYNAKNTGRPYNPSDPNAKYVSRYLDESNDPLFPFGFGLSYTTFAYSGIEATVNGKEITVKVQVTNTGKCDGMETAQLYIRDKVGSITRPVKELKGFQKVLLKKGESRILTFNLTTDDLAFYHSDLKKYYEPGEFVAFVGTNSANNISASFIMK